MEAMDASAPSIGDPEPQRALRSRLFRLAAYIDAALENHFEKERDQLPLWLPVGLGLVFMLEQPLRDGRAGTEPERTGWEGIVDASD